MAKKQVFTEDTLRAMGLQRNTDGSYSKAKTVQQPREKLTQLTTKEIEDIAKKMTTERRFEKDHIDDIKPKTDKLVIAWAGKDISLNAWYSSKHWTHRNKQKQDWHEFFKKFLTQPYPYFEQYDITLECNSRLDPSNCITMIKLCEDTLQECGVLKNDTAEFCRGLHIIPVDSMKKKSYKITIISK